jgi:4,5-dihydroxyphthalate decarboxylase
MKLLIGRDDQTAAAVAAVGAAAPGTDVELVDIRPVNRASRPFIEGGAIDVCEIPIVTLLQAIAYDKPVGLLPVTALARFQHQTLVTTQGLGVDQLAGRSVGVRSWSQTTGVWLRGFLAEDYGIDIKDVDWVVYDTGHVEEYEDPAWVSRAEPGAKLVDDFLGGDVEFAILGNDLPKDAEGITTAIPEPEQAGLRWSRAAGFPPVNHVVGVDLAFAKEHADLVQAVFHGLRPAPAERGDALAEPYGFSGLRGPFERAAQFAYEQEVLPRLVPFDEIVGRTCEALSVSADALDA